MLAKYIIAEEERHMEAVIWGAGRFGKQLKKGLETSYEKSSIN